MRSGARVGAGQETGPGNDGCSGRGTSQDAFAVAVDDQEPVEAFAAKGADETLRNRVRLRRPRRRADDPFC
jgi:hypothetical protein